MDTGAPQPGTLPLDLPPGGAQGLEIVVCADALRRGDFRQARQRARQLLATDEVDHAERVFAEQVLRRTGMDPVALLVGVASLLAFLMIVYFAFAHR